MAVFEVKLEDQVSAPAAAASTALGSLAAEFDALQKQMAAEKAAVSSALAAEFSQNKSIAAEQEKNFASHAKARDESAKSEADMIKALQQKALAGHDADAAAAAGLKKQKDEAAKVAQEFRDLTKTGDATAEQMGALREMAEGAAQAFAIGAVIIAAYAAALYSLASNAIRFTQEKDALRATFDVFTGGGGQALLDGLEDLAATLPFTADKLNAWAKSLLAAGIQGDALKESIKAISAATAIMGESGGQAALGLIKRFAMMAEAGQKVTLDRRILAQMAEAGVSVQALAKALGVAPEKLGKMSISAKELGKAMQTALVQQGAKPLALMGQTWASISAKVREGFEDAFEDLGDLVGPFMAQLQSLAGEFFAGGIASGTFKDAVKAALTVVFEVGTRTVRALHIAFLELEIAFLKAKIALAPLTSALKDVGISAGIVNVAMYLLAGTAVVLAVVFGVLALAVALVALPFIIAGLAIYGVVKAISYLVGVIGGAIDHVDDLKGAVVGGLSGIIDSVAQFSASIPGALAGFVTSAASAGLNFVIGLVQALLTGKGPVADAAKSLAMSAVSAVTGALGIKSPSRVMMRVGGHVSEGLALGIEDGGRRVEGAAAGSADAAVEGAQGAAGRAGASTGRGSTTVNLVVNVDGSTKKWTDITLEQLATALELVADMAGA